MTELDTEMINCALCQGTGIGQSGDPNTSKCWHCNGRGYFIPRDIDAEEEDADRKYDEWRDEKRWQDRE